MITTWPGGRPRKRAGCGANGCAPSRSGALPSARRCGSGLGRRPGCGGVGCRRRPESRGDPAQVRRHALLLPHTFLIEERAEEPHLVLAPGPEAELHPTRGAQEARLRGLQVRDLVVRDEAVAVHGQDRDLEQQDPARGGGDEQRQFLEPAAEFPILRALRNEEGPRKALERFPRPRYEVMSCSSYGVRHAMLGVSGRNAGAAVQSAVALNRLLSLNRYGIRAAIHSAIPTASVNPITTVKPAIGKWLSTNAPLGRVWRIRPRTLPRPPACQRVSFAATARVLSALEPGGLSLAVARAQSR